ncbi:MAG TPA: sulfotransferase, partial [Acidimicrobiales bacterium]|nr:sulfotransferase [Acidimicrobiales bacterium]
AKAGYERHLAEVRERIPAERLVEWVPSDGWGPLCRMLDVPVPDEPFPVTNTTKDFRSQMGWD